MADIKLTMFFKKYKILIRSCAFNPIVCACIVRKHIQTFVFLCVSLFWCSLEWCLCKVTVASLQHQKYNITHYIILYSHQVSFAPLTVS